MEHGDHDALQNELEALREILGEAYQEQGASASTSSGLQPDAQRDVAPGEAPVTTAKRAAPLKPRARKRKRTADANETHETPNNAEPAVDGAPAALQHDAPPEDDALALMAFPDRIENALSVNEELSKRLRALRAEVERRIDENDSTAQLVRDAGAMDCSLSAHAAQLQFSMLPRHQRSTVATGALSGDRYMHSADGPAPPLSVFFHAHGRAPAPNDAAKRLARLYWRRPAHARPPAPWREEECGRLVSAIAQVAAQSRRKALMAEFKRNAAGSSDGAAGPSSGAAAQQTHAERQRALIAELTAEEPEAAQHAAVDFTAQQWHAVAQHVQARAGHECRVRFLAHAHPAHDADAGRELTHDEAAAFAAAVDAHGVRAVDAAGAATGLRWPRWRLLQAQRRFEARSVTTEAWDTSRDEELKRTTQRLIREAPPGRKVSWLSVAHEMGGSVSSLECRARIMELKHELQQHGTWSAAEDEALDAALAKHGKAWWLVAEEMPNRTARQCAEHYKDRQHNVQDAEQLLSKLAFARLVRLKVRHCKGVRIPKWDKVAEDFGAEMGRELSVESCRVLNKRLVKRLNKHGMPEGANAHAQLAYIEEHPDALDTADDARMTDLMAWALQEGFVAQPARTAQTAHLAPDTLAGAQAPAGLLQPQSLNDAPLDSGAAAGPSDEAGALAKGASESGLIGRTDLMDAQRDMQDTSTQDACSTRGRLPRETDYAASAVLKLRQDTADAVRLRRHARIALLRLTGRLNAYQAVMRAGNAPCDESDDSSTDGAQAEPARLPRARKKRARAAPNHARRRRAARAQSTAAAFGDDSDSDLDAVLASASGVVRSGRDTDAAATKSVASADEQVLAACAHAAGAGTSPAPDAVGPGDALRAGTSDGAMAVVNSGQRHTRERGRSRAAPARLDL